jgi:hypothetical protein
MGPEPIPQWKLNDRLATAIQQAVSDPGMQRRAVELGARIRAEDGIRRAVEMIGAVMSPVTA